MCTAETVWGRGASWRSCRKGDLNIFWIVLNSLSCHHVSCCVCEVVKPVCAAAFTGCVGRLFSLPSPVLLVHLLRTLGVCVERLWSEDR